MTTKKNIQKIRNTNKKTKSKLSEGIKKHISDCIALNVESAPVMAAFEVGVAGLSVATSVNSRIMSTLINFLGIGFVFTKGRDISKRFFKITDKTKETIHTVHDAIYGGMFNLIYNIPIYAVSQLIAGETITVEKIATATLIGAVISLFNGPPMGYVVDVYRDLIGVRECNRASYPNILKRQSPFVKKMLFGAFTLLSVGILWIIYRVLG